MLIVHAADLHLDSPLRGLGSLVDAPVEVFRLATRRAFENLVSRCIETEASVLLIAGDIFDGEQTDSNSAVFFARKLAQLGEHGCRVVLLFGNHDAQCRLTKILDLPDSATLLGSRKPESVCFDDLGIVVHGQSFARREVTENLASGYPPPVPHLLNIGLLHTNAIGSTTHDNYAPCTQAQLAAHGYDYWALGHIHTRTVLSEDPWIVYPGNLQGRHARELGARGATFIEVEDGQIASVRHEDLDVARWGAISIDVASLEDLDEIIDRAETGLAELRASAGDRPMLVRITLTGTTTLSGQLAARSAWIRDQLQVLAAQSGSTHIERVVDETAPPRLQATDSGELSELSSELQQELDTLSEDEEHLEDYLESFSSLATTANRHLSSPVVDPDRIQRLLPRVRALLASVLVDGGVDAASEDVPSARQPGPASAAAAAPGEDSLDAPATTGKRRRKSKGGEA